MIFGAGMFGGKSARVSATITSADVLVLGLDGGGTKTVAWLARVAADQSYEVVGRGRAGASNLRAVGASAALKNLDEAISAAWRESGASPRSVELAVFALSGAGQPDVQQQVADWVAERQVARSVQNVHDGEAVLAAGTPEGWGIALIAGTGSSAIGRCRDGKQAVAGGWGYLFGDEGSAFWLGQAALRAVSQMADGRGSSTCLTDFVIERLQVDDPRAIFAKLCEGGQPRLAIAQLAEVVTIAAEQGDPTALRIVGCAVDALAGLVHCVAKQLSFGERFPLAFAGGVLCGSAALRTQLIETLGNDTWKLDPIQLVAEPVAGCLNIASCELVRASRSDDAL